MLDSLRSAERAGIPLIIEQLICSSMNNLYFLDSPCSAFGGFKKNVPASEIN